MIYLSDNLVLASHKDEIECLQCDLNICGRIINLNGVWSFNLHGEQDIYRVAQRQDVTCITSCEIPDVLDKLKQRDIVICHE